MPTPSATRRPRVLVAEDDPALRRLLELRLSVGDFDVRTVEDGSDALDAAREWRPDVLVCDVMMPKVSGLTVCRELRDDADFNAMPIILLTARVFDEDIERVLMLGSISFMNKPFDLGELHRNIDAAIGRDVDEGIAGSDRLGWSREAKPARPIPLAKPADTQELRDRG